MFLLLYKNIDLSLTIIYPGFNEDISHKREKKKKKGIYHRIFLKSFFSITYNGDVIYAVTATRISATSCRRGMWRMSDVNDF